MTFNSNKHYVKLCVTADVYNMIMVKCLNLYLETHPEMVNVKITQNKLMYELAKFYLNAEDII